LSIVAQGSFHVNSTYKKKFSTLTSWILLKLGEMEEISILSKTNFVLSKSDKRFRSYGRLKKDTFCVHSTVTLSDFFGCFTKIAITLLGLGVKT